MLLVAFVFRRKGGLILLCQLARVHEFPPLCEFSFLFPGNTFSSLSGMVFEWSVAKDEDVDSVELSDKIR